MNTTTLDNIIRNICAVRGDMPAANYAQVARIARMAVSQIGLHLPQASKAEVFTVPDNYLLPLPNTVKEITKVGVINSEGYLVLLWENDHLRKWLAANNTFTPEDCDCDEVAAQTIDSVGADVRLINNFYYTPVEYGELYGYMPDRYPYGSWRHNIEAGVLELAGGMLVTAGDKLVVEYIQAAGADLLHNIPIEAEMVIFYKTLTILDTSQRPNVANYNHSQFMREWNHLKRFYNRRHPSEWAASFRQHTKAGPKW
jgi:hypothetical protein